MPDEPPREPDAPAPRELFLIDGNSLVYRAFFALPETISTSKGDPTNAILGFASMLVKIVTDYGVKPTLVVWDAGMSGREQDFQEYKAERRERPDLLAEQWPHMAPLVEAFGYTNVRFPGYEADDVIATLAGRAAEQGIDVTVVTGDRDLFQLIDGHVRVLATSRGITDTKMYDREAVLDRYGIPPELFPDFVGLKGDTSDNIPGVPGIGEKTAAQLLQEHGDLDAVLASVESISGAKRKRMLTEHADDARISKRLATAIRDVPIEVDLAEVVAREPARARLREAFREFELREPLRRLEEALGGEDEAAPRERPAEELLARARRVQPAALAALVGEHAALAVELAGAVEEGGTPEEDRARAAPEQVEEACVAALELAEDPSAAELELETEAAAAAPELGPPSDAASAAERAATGEPPALARGELEARAVRFAAYAGGDEVLVGEAETAAAVALAWGGRPLVAHDWKSIAAADASCASPPLEHDTMVAAYLIDPARRGYPLAELADDEAIGARVEGESNGVAARAVVTRSLALRQRERLRADGLESLFREVELPLVEVLIEMERSGVKLDVPAVRRIAERVREQADQLERDVWTLAGEEFTIGSPQQLAQVLFEKLGLTRKRRGKTGFSTDARVLAAIRDEHEIVPKVEEWRELTKLESTYLQALPELVDSASRLHTTFNQTATTTGRLSSTDPNLQNIPIRTELGREIRACFVAEAGHKLISADYSQVELRLLSHIAGEEALKEIFRRGEDVHTATAAWILGEEGTKPDPGTRSKAKMVNYGIVYGLSAFGLADRLQIPQEEAQEFIDRYLARFPAVKRFIEATIERAKEEGYVTTLFGRIRRIPELRARQRQTRLLGERLAVNMVIQGTAADIIKVAMVRCRDALRGAGLETRLVLQIHDELLFEAPDREVEAAAEIVRREMAGAFELDPPLGVDLGVGDNWLEAK